MNVPAILQVRVWELDEHRSETPIEIYVSSECTHGEGFGPGQDADASIIYHEDFVRLRAAGAMTLLGRTPDESDEDEHNHLLGQNEPR